MSNNVIAIGPLDKCLALVREIECGGDVRIVAAWNLFTYNTEYDQESFYAACRDKLGKRATLDGLCEAYPDSEDPLTDAYGTYITLFKAYGPSWPELALAHYFKRVRKCRNPEAAATCLWDSAMKTWYRDIVHRVMRDRGLQTSEDERFAERDHNLATGMTSLRVEHAAMYQQDAGMNL